MIAYISVGVDDMARAKRFYTAFLPALGYELDEADGELGFALPVPPGPAPVSRPFNQSSMSNRRLTETRLQRAMAA